MLEEMASECVSGESRGFVACRYPGSTLKGQADKHVYIHERNHKLDSKGTEIEQTKMKFCIEHLLIFVFKLLQPPINMQHTLLFYFIMTCTCMTVPICELPYLKYKTSTLFYFSLLFHQRYSISNPINSKFTHQNDIVLAIERRRGEVIIQLMTFEAREAVEMVFHPLPRVAEDVVETGAVRFVHIYRLQNEEKTCAWQYKINQSYTVEPYLTVYINFISETENNSTNIYILLKHLIRSR